MSFRQGRFTEISVSGVALSTYVDSVDMSRDIDMLETTTFTKTSKTYLTGLSEGKVDIAGKYDPTASTGPAALLTNLVGASNSVAIRYFPGGQASGQTVRDFNAFVVSYNESSEVGDVVKFKAVLQVDGPIYASGI